MRADFQILSPNTVKINFEWQDPEAQVETSSPPAGRKMNLWQETCFEAFFKVPGAKSYFEVNLSTQKAWNVFSFQDYRLPQPPTEYPKASVQFVPVQTGLEAVLTLDGIDLTGLNISLCAVLRLKDGKTTYWSLRHADKAPNFHHPDSFILERHLA